MMQTDSKKIEKALSYLSELTSGRKWELVNSFPDGEICPHIATEILDELDKDDGIGPILHEVRMDKDIKLMKDAEKIFPKDKVSVYTVENRVFYYRYRIYIEGTLEETVNHIISHYSSKIDAKPLGGSEQSEKAKSFEELNNLQAQGNPFPSSSSKVAHYI